MVHIPGASGDILRLKKCWKYDAKFTKVHRDKVLVGSVLTSLTVNKTEECIGGCIMMMHCKSINLRNSDNFCELSSQDTAGNREILEAKKGWDVLETSGEEQNVSNDSL